MFYNITPCESQIYLLILQGVFIFNALTTLRLYKKEKLCSHAAIDALFARREGNVSTSFPLRAVWQVNDSRQQKTAQFLISIPKKRFKHAVDRVLLRRRTREAYRLNRHCLEAPDGVALDIAFIYLGSTIAKYDEIEQAMKKLLAKISANLNQPEAPAQNEETV